MSEYFLIDPPITPYSPLSDLLAWASACRAALEKHPGNPQWEDALADVETLIAAAGGRQS